MTLVLTYIIQGFFLILTAISLFSLSVRKDEAKFKNEA